MAGHDPDQPKPGMEQTEQHIDDPPFIPECEVLEEGGPNTQQLFKSCGCKSKMIPVNELTMEHLPEDWRSDWKMTKIKLGCDRTVKLKVKYTSEHRPNTHPDSTAPYPYSRYKRSRTIVRCGTGFIYDGKLSKVTGEKCPCPDCQTAEPKNEYFKVRVCTAAHVVFDDLEAEKTVCEVFYESAENRDGINYLYGVKSVNSESRSLFDKYDNKDSTERGRNDLFFIECVAHDMAFYEILNTKITIQSLHTALMPSLPMIVSHPHGWSKQISFGSYRHFLLQLSETHSSDTAYTIPPTTWVIADTDVTSRYPGLFKRDSNMKNWFYVIKPLKIRIPCSTSQTTELYCDREDVYRVTLPKESTLTSEDGEIELQRDVFTFWIYEVLRVFKDNLVSYHMIYDTPTCSGSSGAYVTSLMIAPQFLPCHFGKLPTGINRSGSYKKM